MPNSAKINDQVDFGGIDPDIVRDLEPKLMTLMQQSEALVALMRDFFHKLDKRRSEEFKIIAGYISKAKEEIREMRPHDISKERIPTAGAELEAITRDTENATHTIMNAAEAIMGFDTSDPNAYKAAVDDEVMKIFEACSFQDITGQRVTKVINVLSQIEERVGKLANALGVEDQEVVELSAREIRDRDLLLHGPAIGGPEVKQDAIDAMFGEDDGFATVEAAPTPAVNAEVKPAAVAETKPAAKPAPAPAPAAPVAAAEKPQALAEVAPESNSQDDIDAMFSSMDGGEAEGEMDMEKLNSQDDIDALFG